MVDTAVLGAHMAGYEYFPVPVWSGDGALLTPIPVDKRPDALGPADSIWTNFNVESQEKWRGKLPDFK